ncbi:Tat pathway signal sequence domain protein [Planosporangium thailandense]|uniref:Tat pathway signal sequence domain protein n=2 Tax=Planosporangium thailandense TaxID=765197 RepID=A0ABX0XR76_9ACTN|nr:Tat pathway signal sequence domain protein [Planosporangium thailandense]NJC68504.1 Tat pathway signal sequence domain protein [Planosporangium thailandense]
MRAYSYLAATVVAALLTAAAAVPASAATTSVLTTGDADGGAIAVGDVLQATLKSGTNASLATASGGSTGVTCSTSSFGATVDSNPATPGTATETTTDQTFGGCTSNVFGTTGVKSVTVNNLPYVTSVDSGTGAVRVTGGSAGPIQTTLVLNSLLGTITCVYQADGNALTGTASNADFSLTFVNQKFTKVSGSGVCAANGFFTATYAPVQDTSVAGTPGVFVN